MLARALLQRLSEDADMFPLPRIKEGREAARFVAKAVVQVEPILLGSVQAAAVEAVGVAGQAQEATLFPLQEHLQPSWCRAAHSKTAQAT